MYSFGNSYDPNLALRYFLLLERLPVFMPFLNPTICAEGRQLA